MAAEHYFSPTPGGDPRPRTIDVRLAGRDLQLQTAGGVFSPDRIDVGTAVLLANAPTPPPGGNLLDLGCGWGPVALTLALESPHATVWAVDVNERALDLVRANAMNLSIPNIKAVTPENVPDDVAFMTIWSNPPIRVGKQQLHAILEQWMPRLLPGSDAWLVVQRNLGADSLQRWLQARLSDAFTVTRAESSKGFRVLRVRHRSGATGAIEVVAVD
jgi:16S rRNA G1207 methylase RsmC